MTDIENEKLECRRLADAGMSQVAIAAKLGISRHAVQRRLRDPAVQTVMDKIGLRDQPYAYWDKSNPDYSVYVKPQSGDAQANWIDAVRGAFEGITPAEPVTVPRVTNDDLLTVYPLMDAHIGMFAWGKETGGADYDLSHAVTDMRQAFASLGVITPASGNAILILGGDTLHADDGNAETPQSKHKLDVDGRHFKAIQTAIQIVCEAVDTLAEKHAQLEVKVLRGNHDESSHMALTFALNERYRNHDTVTVDIDPRDLFMRQWGKSLIAAHHGDKGNPTRLAMHIADACPFWSATRDRHVLTGHIHHDSTKDLGGIKWWSLRAFCPPDEYGSKFSSRRALQAMTFHRVKGLLLNAIDPIWRE